MVRCDSGAQAGAEYTGQKVHEAVMTLDSIPVENKCLRQIAAPSSKLAQGV
jgi:hypothetical protein